MKFENFVLSVQTLKFVKNNPGCTAPQIREDFGIFHSVPPVRKEKDLYKVIRYLDSYGFIDKNNHEVRTSGGTQFSLKVTHKGEDLLSTFRNIFQDVLFDYSFLETLSSAKDQVDIEKLRLDFLKFARNTLEKLRTNFLNLMRTDPGVYYQPEKKEKLNEMLDDSSELLQKKVGEIINKLM